MNLPELAANERYDTVRKRAEHAGEIVPKLHEALHERTALEWEAHFGDQVPCAAARAIEDVFDNEQVLAEDMVTTLDHSLVGKYRGLTRPIKFDRTPGPAPFAAPKLRRAHPRRPQRRGLLGGGDRAAAEWPLRTVWLTQDY